MTKPKKPLRSLFASTEAPAPMPSRPVPAAPSQRREPPKQSPVPAKSKTIPERLAPHAHIKAPTPTLIMSEEPTPMAAAIPAAIPETIAEAIPETIPAAMPMAVPVPTPNATQERIFQIHYNFDSMRPTREEWSESDYAQFLHRLDAIQTEAFILRGKLLHEVKNRFYETNKIGWADFCDRTLDMNYTTANQYIRVATEFDVTSHQRPDFGFEHFKALLPLPIEARSEFLNTEGPLSVKVLRSRVREILISSISAEQNIKPQSPVKQSSRILKMLEALKTEISKSGTVLEALNHTQRWQLASACQNIANHLHHLAHGLESNPSATSGQKIPSFRAGAFATADGVANMKDIVTVVVPTDETP